MSDFSSLNSPLVGLDGLPISETNLIARPSILPVTIKRLATKDGKGRAADHIRIGQPFLVDKSSIGYAEFVNKEGEKFEAATIHIVDVQGRDLGWMYAELFFV